MARGYLTCLQYGHEVKRVAHPCSITNKNVPFSVTSDHCTKTMFQGIFNVKVMPLFDCPVEFIFVSILSKN